MRARRLVIAPATVDHVESLHGRVAARSTTYHRELDLVVATAADRSHPALENAPRE